MGSSYIDLHAWLSGSLCVAKGGLSWVFNALHFSDNLSPARVLSSVLTWSSSPARVSMGRKLRQRNFSAVARKKAGYTSAIGKRWLFASSESPFWCTHVPTLWGLWYQRNYSQLISIFSKRKRGSKMISPPSKNWVALWGISDSLKTQVYAVVDKIQWGGRLIC